MLALLKQLRSDRHWWSEFTLQTKLMAAATLVVSLVMSGLTFWAVNTIQHDARLNDTALVVTQDCCWHPTAPLIAEDNLTEVAQFSQRF